VRIYGEYPPDWREISYSVKAEHRWKCERCGHPDDRAAGYLLTVHHLDGNKSNCERWNLAALCQRCHLSVQARVDFTQGYSGPHSLWMAVHVVTYNAWALPRGLPLHELGGLIE